MICEMMTDAERYYVDERLCGVNGMAFEEWERYQDYMIKYYGGYFGDGLYEEEYEDYESDKEDSQDENDESDNDNHDRVCLCDPTDIREATCCCNHSGLECNGKCHADGYDR